MKHTRSQGYAKAAYDKVAKVAPTSTDSATAKKYGALALNFPVLILQAGLAQASGFVLAKAKAGDPQMRYLDDLAAVLGEKDAHTLHQKIINSSLSDYRDLTRRTLEAAGWFKRYAQGLLGAKTTDGGDQS